MFAGGRSRAVVALVLGFTLALALTGCGGGGSKPVSLPTLPSATNSPTPSATSSQTELDAVSAVVRRYFELINGPTTVANADQLFAIMTPACKCRRVATSVRDAARRHQSYYGRATVTSFVPNLDGPNDADVLVDYDSSISGLRDGNGRTLHRDRAIKGMSADFRMVRRQGNWLIDIVQIIRDGTPT